MVGCAQGSDQTTARAMLADGLASSAIGDPDAVRQALDAFIARNQPDELMLTPQIFDHGARLHSYEIAAELLRDTVPI